MTIPDFAARLAAVRERIAGACARAGRDPESVRLIAVSKTHGPETVREAAGHGLTVFGENRVQEAAAKIPECPGHLSWHLVGHLQRNKVRPAVEYFDFIHSVDSTRLLETIDRVSQECGKTMPVCIEVSGEGAKFGVAPDGLPEVLAASARLTQVRVAGLMTIPPLSKDAGRTRGYFRALRELRDAARASSGLALEELSMGMSGDFEIAIEEGATMIRVGTDLFGPRGT
jgi:pyridoxal phosphate enzyme (YggS family)